MPKPLCVLVFAVACSGTSTSSQPTPVEPATPVARPRSNDGPQDAAAAIAASVAHTDRPAEDRDRDADRRPAEILSFFGVAPGMKVADMMTGRGYYAELVARVVGDSGVVYAQNNKFVVERFADKPLGERLARPGLQNVVRLDRELEDPGLPAGELDVVLMVLFYHDTVWQKTDRAAMNRAIFAALKPGGIFGVVDHHAEDGSGERDVKTLHRVDAALVEKEILAAGFELVERSDLLRHPEDERTLNVFDEAIRGKTDRFVYKFRKPER
jgi:predicted methyltransferase